jgi:inhibitor of KinA sporulation pathway (predicted exonuclease)
MRYKINLNLFFSLNILLIGIDKMLGKLGLSFDGRRHSGLDDAINIARIAVELLKVWFFFRRRYRLKE